MRSNEIIHGSKLLEVIREQLKRALLCESVDASEHAEFYLVNLLNEYHMAGNIPDLEDETRPIGIAFLEAMSKSQSARAIDLKKIGDGALIAVGFYEESIRKGIVDSSYYINIGGSAYNALSDVVVCDSQFADVYAELSANFSSLVNVLTHMAPWNKATSNSDLMMIYRRWLENGDERLRPVLERSGLITEED